MNPYYADLTKRLGVVLTVADRDALERLAADAEDTASAYCRKLIRAHLRENAQRLATLSATTPEPATA